MGGDGHGHHHPTYTIPDYKIYKVENVPELMATKQALQSQGLKDPWMRNEVWRYDTKIFGTEGTRAKAFFLKGARNGLAAAVVTVIATVIFDKVFPSDHGHGHDEHH